MFPQVFGKFVLEGELSSGGMARVFVATLRGAVGFEKRLVVKQIRPELASDARFVQRFVTEAKTSVELTHPNIVPVYELGVEAGVYYIAMELCPGVTLAELFRAEGALSLEEGAHVGVELARALGYAHRRAGIVHSDVTPRNVLVDDEGAVRLIDFGIAAPVAADESAEREVFGTPGHMPPEQIRGDRLTPATDVFALAALLYETWSGEAPFRRSTQEDSLRSVWNTPARIATRVPELSGLGPLLDACLSPEPSRRPGDIDELGRALRELLREADSGDLALALGNRVRRVRRVSRSDAQTASFSGARPWGTSAPAGRSTHTTPLSSEAREASPFSKGDTSAHVSRTFATRPLSLPPPAPGKPEAPEANASSTAALARRLDAEVDVEELGAPVLGSPAREPARVSLGEARRWLVWGGAAALVLVSIAGALEKLGAVEAAPAGGAPVPAVLPASLHASSPTTNAGTTRAASAPKTGAEVPLRSEAVTFETPSASPPDVSEGSAARAAPLREAPPREASERGAAPARVVTSVSGTQPKETALRSGSVALTAAPRAEVSIAGRTLQTPVKDLRLPVGSYRATFRSPAWDGAVSAAVEVTEATASAVHADFTSEPPRVVVR